MHRSASTFCIRGWSISSLPKADRCAAWWVARATPSRIPDVEPSTQSRRVWLTISMMVGTPRPSSPTICAQAPSNSTSLDAFERFPSLSFRRWRWKRLRVPSGRIRGSRKHDSPPSACASTRNASHIGAEQNHLWPVISYSRSGAAAVQRPRDGHVGAHVRAALLLGHRHAAQGAALVGGMDQARVVGGRRQTRLPLVRQLWRRPQRRHAGVGHRDRAEVTALRLTHRHERGGARNMAAGPLLRPGQRVQSVRDGDVHQLVPGGVELHLVDAVAVAVVGAQLGRVLVRLPAPLDRLAAGDLAHRADLRLGPAATLAVQRLDQRAVLLEDVVRLQRRDLVDHLMGGPARVCRGSVTAMPDPLYRCRPRYL